MIPLQEVQLFFFVRKCIFLNATGGLKERAIAGMEEFIAVGIKLFRIQNYPDQTKRYMMPFDLTYIQENCSGCLRCQLACSRAYARRFQPAAARIRITTAGEAYGASFMEDCTACGLCADSCLFGALLKRKREASP